MRSLRPTKSRQYADRNLDLLALWRVKVYDRRKLHRGSKESLLGAMNRMLLGLGGLEIGISPIEDVQKAIDKLPDQRRMAMCCNVLLAFKGCEERIALELKVPQPITRISLSELLAIKFPDEITRIAALTSFGTGVRFGELFEIRKAGAVIRVDKQRYYDWSIGLPKRDQARNVAVISECRPFVEAWVNLPEEQKKAFRTRKVGLIMKVRVGITWHALRHSYAVHLRMCGVSFDDIAQSLGDSIETVQSNYAGFVMDDVAAARLAKRI
jgi:integrase